MPRAVRQHLQARTPPGPRAGARSEAHRNALERLDRTIMEGDVNPEVLGVLQAMRASVAAHLELAMQIRSRL